MAINQLIKNSKLKEEFEKTFVMPKFISPEEIKVVLPLSENYSLMGTAFDYLLRFYIARINKIKDQEWISEKTLAMLKYQKNSRARVKEIISKFKIQYEEYLKNGIVDDSLLESIIMLAKIDGIFRSGGMLPDSFETDEKDIEDLKNLASIIPIEKFSTKQICFLNPTFGNASLMVGGGDADLIIGESLIDIKTTKDLKFTKDYFIQLVSYYLLNKIGGVSGYRSKVEINKLGIYFSRYGYLFEFNICDIVTSKKQLEKFIDLYIDVAQGFA